MASAVANIAGHVISATMRDSTMFDLAWGVSTPQVDYPFQA